jgi:hypothetical protein
MEFIGRFLQHVLPGGFHKVRYYGLLSPSNRKTLTVLQDIPVRSKQAFFPRCVVKIVKVLKSSCEFVENEEQYRYLAVPLHYAKNGRVKNW